MSKCVFWIIVCYLGCERYEWVETHSFYDIVYCRCCKVTLIFLHDFPFYAFAHYFLVVSFFRLFLWSFPITHSPDIEASSHHSTEFYSTHWRAHRTDWRPYVAWKWWLLLFFARLFHRRLSHRNVDPPGRCWVATSPRPAVSRQPRTDEILTDERRRRQLAWLDSC